MKHPPRYVVWDLETTGLDPTTDKAVELAFMVVEGDEIIEEYSTLIVQDEPIPEGATKVHGITQEMCAVGVTEQKAYTKLLEALEYCNWHNVGVCFPER